MSEMTSEFKGSCNVPQSKKLNLYKKLKITAKQNYLRNLFKSYSLHTVYSLVLSYRHSKRTEVRCILCPSRLQAQVVTDPKHYSYFPPLHVT